jgi:hypothetical protein
MKRAFVETLLGLALMAMVAVAAGAEELTVDSILAAQKTGASADAIITMIKSPDNTLAMTVGDIATLRDAGVPEAVITTIWAFIPVPPPAPVALQPEDSRLVDVVRLIKSGMSESIIAEQVRQSGQAYNLSVNDLLYLKHNGAQESTIGALMATRAAAPAEPAVPPSAALAPAPVVTPAPAVAPDELVFDDLLLVKPFYERNRAGRLVLKEETFSWVDRDDPAENFAFQTTGLEKVWYTCEPRTPENFCYQINFKIVKGDRYQFRDSHHESGSSAAVTNIMEALRTRFPRLAFGAPDS